jgi:hypothetical protein
MIKLLGYKYAVEYKKGRENRVADALSRVKYHLSQLFKSTEGDEKCQDIISKLLLDAKAVPHYTLTSGVLRYKHKIFIGQGNALREKLLQSMHNSELGGHW